MPHAIILDASYGMRFLDSSKSYPTSLRKLQSSESALDWNLAALKKEGIRTIVYVGGYHIEKVVKQYPDLKYHFHSNWEKEGYLKALIDAGHLMKNGGLVIDARIVFRPEAIQALKQENADLVIGIEPIETEKPRIEPDDVIQHPEKRGGKFRFAGLMMFSRAGAKMILDRARELSIGNPTIELKSLVQELIRSGSKAKLVDLTGMWSSLTQAGELARFVVGTKAQTLERLQPLLRSATILDQIKFTVSGWRTSPETILEKIQSSFKTDRLVVRSSAWAEDSWTESNAGRFESILDVAADSAESIGQAVERVIESYRRNGSVEAENQVLVQPFVDSVVMSGVLFTRELETHAPYYVINYHHTERTDTVTAGTSSDLKTIFICKNGNPDSINKKFLPLVEMAREVEALIGHDSLDIEFAVHESGRIYVFQVRPIATRKRAFIPTDDDFEAEIKETKEFVKQAFQKNINLLGESSLFSNMSDWNPAEMIGTHPRLLATSLYQYLITDNVWGTARRMIGYRDTYPSPLMVVISGQPYIDLRASFNSFIPDSVSKATAEKCVIGYTQYLNANPEYHDKIEFEIAATCFTFDFDRHAQRLSSMGLSSREITELKNALVALTDRILTGETCPIARNLDLLKEMERRRMELIGIPENRLILFAKIKQILADCARFGTLPFSILARYAFISISIMRSLRSRGVLTEEEYETCMHIPSIATEISDDMEAVLSGNQSREDFLDKYGHLRPGTYDIMSPNYREASHVYLNAASCGIQPKRSLGKDSAWKLMEIKFPQIEDLLHESGMKCTPPQLREFIFSAVRGREFAKFEFTKNINLALEWIRRIGSHWGLDREELSHLSIFDILKFATDSQHSAMRTLFKRSITFEKKRYELNRSVKLPHLIRDPLDIEICEVPECTPNFVTTKVISAEVVLLEEHNIQDVNLRDKIVAIRKADPGFDWIFVHGISGLVTQYGGVASHMAIRAAEFGLPAAIGCGEVLFKRIAAERFITLDCSGRRIEFLRSRSKS